MDCKNKFTVREKTEAWAIYIFMVIIFGVFAYGMQLIVREALN